MTRQWKSLGDFESLHIALLAPFGDERVEGVRARRIRIAIEPCRATFREVSLVVVVTRRTGLEEPCRDDGETLDFSDPCFFGFDRRLRIALTSLRDLGDDVRNVL